MRKDIKSKMILEEAIKILRDDNKTYQLNKLLNDTLNIECPKYYWAIETVLKALEYKDKQIDDLYRNTFDLEDYRDKYETGELIPKKEIEDKLKYKKRKLQQIKSENDNYRQNCLQIEIDTLEELLEDK